MNKVLVLTNSINGLYSFRRELIDRLIEDEFAVSISSPRDTRSDFFSQIGCSLIETPINRRGTNPLTDLKLLSSYFGIIRRIKPDAVLTYTIKPNVFGGIACRMLGVPYIVNITGLGTAVENGGMLQKITVFLYRVSLKNSKCVFFQNEENRNFFIEERIVTGNSRLIPGSGVNLQHFSLLDYPEDPVIKFMFIGRIMKEKGIEQYLDAADRIKKKHPDTEFHVIGFCEEEYEEKLKELHYKGIIRYHGSQSDVRKFHEISNCTIHPTYYPEGMSNVLLESAASGRPVITTDRSGCREIVDDGVNGYIVKQQDSQDLIEKIEKFLKLSYEEKKNMGLAGRAKVEKEFDRNIVVSAYIEEIDSIKK